MNQEIFNAKWKQIRGKSKVWWAKLNDKDLDRIAGRYEILVGVLQEKYAYTRQQAAREIDRRVSDYGTRLKKMKPGSKSR